RCCLLTTVPSMIIGGGITISGAGWLTYWLLPCSILNRKSSVLLNGTRSIGYWKNRTSAPRTGLMPDLPLPSGKFLAFSLSSSERLRSLVTKLPAVPFHWGGRGSALRPQHRGWSWTPEWLGPIPPKSSPLSVEKGKRNNTISVLNMTGII